MWRTIFPNPDSPSCQVISFFLPISSHPVYLHETGSERLWEWEAAMGVWVTNIDPAQAAKGTNYSKCCRGFLLSLIKATGQNSKNSGEWLGPMTQTLIRTIRARRKVCASKKILLNKDDLGGWRVEYSGNSPSPHSCIFCCFKIPVWSCHL